MAIQTINIGSSANKGDGDPLRTAFTKINANFAELAVTNQNRDINGSVFADDSTLLVDAVNGTITAAVLVGALPALDGSALTGITASSIAFSSITSTPTTIAGYGITDSIAPLASPSFTGAVKLPVYADPNARDAAIPSPEQGQIVVLQSIANGGGGATNAQLNLDGQTSGWVNIV